jgi:hypothetical protein
MSHQVKREREGEKEKRVRAGEPRQPVEKRKKKRGSLNFGQKFGQTRIKFAH